MSAGQPTSRVLAMREAGGDLLEVGDRVRIELRDAATCVVLGEGARP